MFVQFVKQDGKDILLSSYNTPGGAVNEPVYVLDRWQKPGDIARYQRYTVSFGAAAYAAYTTPNSTAAITDASFIRLKNLYVSYSLPAKTADTCFDQFGQVIRAGQNLFTITNYQGPDPEKPECYRYPATPDDHRRRPLNLLNLSR